METSHLERLMAFGRFEAGNPCFPRTGKNKESRKFGFLIETLLTEGSNIAPPPFHPSACLVKRELINKHLKCFTKNQPSLNLNLKSHFAFSATRSRWHSSPSLFVLCRMGNVLTPFGGNYDVHLEWFPTRHLSVT